MLSRRQFLTMTLIMLMLFAMFQVTGVLKEYWNEYGKNEYAKEDVLPVLAKTSGEADSYVILIGETDENTTGQMVQLWASYRKMEFFCYDSLSAVSKEQAQGARLLFIDSNYLDAAPDTRTLTGYAEQGISMVFCNVPDTEVLEENRDLMYLLGLFYVYAEDVELTGVEVYDGFLLGGTTIYEAADEEEEKQQDLTLHMPWYGVYMGTKTYITGLMDKTAYGDGGELKNESMPPIVWRNSIGDARVFVIAGTYAQDVTALGLYSGMLYEMSDYDLYPVVNAQTLVIANFAALSSEQDALTQSLYSRSQKITFQDLIWPDLSAIYTKSLHVPTFFLAPKLDYTTAEEPDADNLVFYQKLIREQEGENGLTLSQTSEVPLAEKLKADRDFYEEALPDYAFTALYAENGADYEAVSGEAALAGIRTVCMGVDNCAAPVSYAEEAVTKQRTTVNGFEHTYSDDLRLKSLETCLGYSGILVDLGNILVPESGADRWETRAERLASYTVTYWKPYAAFAKTSATECDRRIREFLNLEYQKSRQEDVITLEISNMEEQASFILRTHNEQIEAVEGASFSEIEDDAYLLEAQETTVKIYLKKDQTLYYTNS